MELKDYLHLYLGCEVEYTVSGIKHTLIGLEKNDAAYIFGGSKGRHVVSIYHVKPILRRLSSMTNDESEMMVDAAIAGKATIYVNAEITAFLLSKGFDLFGLIDAGLAIDKTTLPNEPL